MKGKIINQSKTLGFQYCGFSRVRPFDELRDFYSDYLGKGRQAGMDYLARYAEKKLDPVKVVPGARTVIATLMNYYPKEIIPDEDNYIIAKYAYGKDDHMIVKERLALLVDFLKTSCGSNDSRAFFDSGPLLEKALAMRSGTGWIGKNTLLINPKSGSFFLVGIILTDLEIDPDEPGTDHCGTCTLCLDSCPTGAIDAPYHLDIARCISYLTIETKGPVPEHLFPKMKDRIYGCDICQDVCPFNRKALPHQEQEFLPDEKLKIMRKADWEKLTAAEFKELFHNSSIQRIGYGKLMSTINGIRLRK